MLYLEIDSKDAAYHFSVEEYLLQHFALTQPLVMLWQTKPCVMLGQYQIADREVDMKAVEEKEVAIVRRPSGGGAIFTDSGTFLLSLILPAKIDSPDKESSDYDSFPQKAARTEFTDLLISVLQRLDIPAKLEGRNDILLEGKKISGMAQHVHKGRSCTHGSLLFAADLELLVELLRVDDEKFKSKAVKSIRSRVTNIKEYAAKEDLPLASATPQDFATQFKSVLYENLNAREYHLSAEDEAGIKDIYHKKYGNPDWVRKKAPKFDLHAIKRFPAGKLEVYLSAKKGIVSSCSIHGDFLGTIPTLELEQQLLGLPYKRSEFKTALNQVEQVNLSSYLGELSVEEFLSCVFD